MRCVFISKAGDILPVAQRMEDEGNGVELFICNDEDTLVDRHITEYSPDLVVIDSYGFGHLTNRLKNAGILVLGSSLLTDELEGNKEYNNKVLMMCGLDTDGPQGLPVILDGWFNGKDFINNFYTVDDVVFPGSKSDKFYLNGLGRLTGILKKAKYSGPISLETITNKNSFYCQNLQARFSHGTTLIMKEALKGRLTDVLLTMAKGINRCFMFKPGWFTSIQVSLNPNPLFNSNPYYELAANGLTDDVVKHLWLYGFVKKASDNYVYRGRGGRIAVIASRGDTIREARRRAYRTAHNLKMSDILYLPHVGQRATPQYGSLKTWGYIS